MINMFNHFLILRAPYCHVVVSSEQKFGEVIQDISGAEMTLVRVVEGKKCGSPETLFDEFAKKLEFPNYFGRNWPAFNECINDLEWFDVNRFVILIKNADRILDKRHNVFDVFMRILGGATEEWVGGRNYDSFPTNPTPFHIVFHCVPKNADAFVSKIRATTKQGIEFLRLSDGNGIES